MYEYREVPMDSTMACDGSGEGCMGLSDSSKSVSDIDDSAGCRSFFSNTGKGGDGTRQVRLVGRNERGGRGKSRKMGSAGVETRGD